MITSSILKSLDIPHQTLPLEASYAYIRNARNNHMPLPAMTYSQLYGGE